MNKEKKREFFKIWSIIYKKTKTQKHKKRKYMKPEFDAWISEKWIVSGGLISPATAAQILKKTAGRITQMTSEKKIRLYKYENKTFVSFADVMKIARKQRYDEIMKEIETIKKDKSVPEEIKRQYVEDITPTLELLNNSIETD